MKRLSVLALCLLLAVLMVVPASAASAFSNITVTKDTQMIDSGEGTAGKNIGFVDGYGVGNSQKNDVVVFPDVDFGTLGAKDMTIYFSYGAAAGSPDTTCAAYIDDYKTGKPICSFTIAPTGGWKTEFAKEFKQNCTVASGKHTVYVVFTNNQSGSFAWIKFTQADPKVETTTKAAATTAKAAAASTAKAAQTPDLIVVPAVLAVASVATFAVSRKKRG